MISIALRVLNQIASKPFRSVLLKSIGITLLVMIALGFGLFELFDRSVVLSNHYLDSGTNVLAGLGLTLGLLFLIVPTTTLVAGFFLDDIAQMVESESYPHEPLGQELSLWESLKTALMFTGVIIVANILALFLLLIPGVNLIAFFVINGYLLGREYFDLAARRYRSKEDAKVFRQSHRGRVFLGGLLMALLVSVPILNLITPLFATAYMVHLHKKLSGSKPADFVAPPFS
jgi:CysZ protein